MRWALLLAFSIVSAWGAEGIPLSEFKQRRAELRKTLDGMLVLFGVSFTAEGLDGYFQEPNFLYLTGWREPGAMAVITPKEEILFLPPRNERRERYEGKHAAAGDPGIEAAAGFDTVLPLHAMQPQFLRLIEQYGKVYFVKNPPEAETFKKFLGFHEVGDAFAMIAKLRMTKSPAEIALLEKATEATLAAHRAAWAMIGPGVAEYEVAGTMSGSYVKAGCERHAYAPIVGSGPNSVVLHYSANRRRMDAGDVVVMDVGAECSSYAADITRTVPVNGKWTPRQREIYDIVLGAQKAAIAAIKPGVTMDELHEIAKAYINSHGKDKAGEPLGKYYLHKLGHHVGLEVHDATAPDVKLAPNMVITIEPGIYIADEKIGVRIEDMVLVTDTGARVISESLPREAEEIEKVLAQKLKD
jgi:Xaa-Pro aminopeptidase